MHSRRCEKAHTCMCDAPAGRQRCSGSADLAASAYAAGFKVLALAESGGHHIEFTKAAKPWLKQCGDENGFEVNYITNTASITEAFLARYQLVLQLDFVPYGWKPEAMAAYKAYIEEGRGGWER